MSEYEFPSKRSTRSGWWVAVPLALAVVAWGVFQYATVRDAPHRWDFGALPDVPGESVYSSSRPAQPRVVPRQISPLPEATPLGAAPSPAPAPSDAALASPSSSPSRASASTQPASSPALSGGRP